MVKKTYNLYVSQSWTYSDTYERLIQVLNRDPSFTYKIYTFKKNDRIHEAADETEFKETLKKKILPCSVILLVAGLYTSYRKWFDAEIEIAKKFPYTKKIIAIQPWGKETISETVEKNADKIVLWTTHHGIIDAIRELG